MRILVIGGTGFIGPAVVRALCSGGHEVGVLHRGEATPDLPVSVEHLMGDRDDLPAERIAAFVPDVVLHDLVMTDAHARHFVDVCGDLADRLVMLSSIDVYRAWGVVLGLEQGPVDLPIDERSPLREVRHPYADGGHPDYDKIPAEGVVREAGGTLLRLPMVYGPGDGQRRLRPLARPLLDGREAVVLDAGWSGWIAPWGYVEHVGAAVARACTEPQAAGRTYDVVDGCWTPLEILHEIATILGWEGQIVLGRDLPEPLAATHATSQHLVIHGHRIRAELGWRPTFDRREALRRTVAWEAEQPDDLSERYAAEDAVLAEIQ